MKISAIIPFVAIAMAIVLNIGIHRSNLYKKKIIAAIVIFVALLFAGGCLFYGWQSKNVYLMITASLIIYGAVDKFFKRIIPATN